MTGVRRTPEVTRTLMATAAQRSGSNTVATTRTQQRAAGAGASHRPARPHSSIASARRDLAFTPTSSHRAILRDVPGRRSTPSTRHDMHAHEDTTTPTDQNAQPANHTPRILVED